MEYVTAKTYENCKWCGEPYEKNNKMYVQVEIICDRCGGTGRLSEYSMIDYGICYKCHGVGHLIKEVRLYTPKERQLLEVYAMRRKEKASWYLMKKNQLKMGFNEDGFTYCVVGNDTYAIKDWLKEQGCRYNAILGWHSPHQLKLDDNFSLVKIHIDEVYEWRDTFGTFVDKEGCKTAIQKKLDEAKGPSLSEYYGEIGERFYDITAVFHSSHGFNGRFGWTNIYTFYHKDNCLVWFTTKFLELDEGAVVNLTATVKSHEEYRGVKTTQLNRAIIKEVK